MANSTILRLFFITLNLSLASLAAENAALKLKLSGSSKIADVDNFKVTATLENTGKIPLKLYQHPQSELSTSSARTFKVKGPGGEPKFIGAITKYKMLNASEFTNLKPGQSIQIEHDLSVGYDFEKSGTYSVISSGLFYYQDSNGEPQPIQAKVEGQHNTDLFGSMISSKVALRKGSHGLGTRGHARYANCDNTQQPIIADSAEIAAALVSETHRYVQSLNASTPRWKQWFGDYNETRKAEVLSHFTRIHDSDVSTYVFDCNCTEGADLYAYVYPDEFGHIYLCGSFWTGPLTGTDSKAGTIVHESSHFTNNGGTGDFAYGQVAASQLAMNNATFAIHNADTHEYFTENTPNLL